MLSFTCSLRSQSAARSELDQVKHSTELAEELTRVASTSEKKMNSGCRLLGDTQGLLKEIFKTTQSVVEMMQIICQASEEQSQGIHQVNYSPWKL